MQRLISTAVLSALTYSTLTSAAPAKDCPTDDVCYSVAVPSASASSGSGNIYIQLRAPTSYAWVGVGQGSSMAGANMFLMYADGSGNVTVSPRTGTGHVMPQANADADVEVLAGTGIADGTMTANFRCGNCDAWSGGQMTLSDSRSSWIAAWKQGAALDSADPDARIERHDGETSASIDLTQATVSEDSNPFVATGGTGGSSGTGGNGNSSSGGSAGGDTDTGTTTPGGAVSPGGAGGGGSGGPGKIIMAHWVVMLIVWVILFPLGSALMPLFEKWILHAAWQFVAFLLMWVGFGLGYVASQRIGLGFQSTHTKFGTVVVCLMALQPLGGWLHHRHYLQHARRGAVSHVHIWYGRALMVMGVVNGGLGIQLASGGDARGKPLTIGYSVAAAVVAVLYLGAKAFGTMRARRGRGARGGGGDGGAAIGSDHHDQAIKENGGTATTTAHHSHSSGSPQRPYP
ncbi:hypothetical protein SLS62_005232 [Diatrype stigma]|uniref:DOMON domain-containing protein n=1 Tax=Diatrype stigma TaxID=117547 RepID=A0AAN9UPL0_9PEZI